MEKVPVLVLETHFMCLAHGLFSTVLVAMPVGAYDTYSLLMLQRQTTIRFSVVSGFSAIKRYRVSYECMILAILLSTKRPDSLDMYIIVSLQ